MAPPVPLAVKNRILLLWYGGKDRDGIARKVGRSGGLVSGVGAFFRLFSYPLTFPISRLFMRVTCSSGLQIQNKEARASQRFERTL